MKPTQTNKILQVLTDAQGDWVNGRKFLHEMYISQYHARIKELEAKGYEIDHSSFKDEYGFSSYRLACGTPASITFSHTITGNKDI